MNMCSLNIVSFFQEFSKVKIVNSPSPTIGCYWLYKKLPANRSDYVHSHCVERALKVSYSDVGVAVNYEKTQFFPEHPVYLSKVE